LSGRFSVMVRICSATSYLIVSYAMVVSFPVLNSVSKRRHA
jgi:hypothetical protein